MHDLTELLGAHRPETTKHAGATFPYECRCGAEFVDGDHDRHWREYERHVQAELVRASTVTTEAELNALPEETIIRAEVHREMPSGRPHVIARICGCTSTRLTAMTAKRLSPPR
jgi:hypothetical protein